MNCRHHGQTELGKTIMASGAFHVWRRCIHCLENVSKPGPWLSLKAIGPIDIESLPIFDDYRLNNPPCAVCGAIGTEEHHFAPKELFPETFERWPKAYLCKLCHQEWHNTITIPLRKLRNRERKKDNGQSNASIRPDLSQ